MGKLSKSCAPRQGKRIFLTKCDKSQQAGQLFVSISRFWRAGTAPGRLPASLQPGFAREEAEAHPSPALGRGALKRAGHRQRTDTGLQAWGKYSHSHIFMISFNYSRQEFRRSECFRAHGTAAAGSGAPEARSSLCVPKSEANPLRVEATKRLGSKTGRSPPAAAPVPGARRAAGLAAGLAKLALTTESRL